MSRKRRTEIKNKQKIKRRKRRKILIKQGKNPDEYFYSGIYVPKSPRQ